MSVTHALALSANLLSYARKSPYEHAPGDTWTHEIDLDRHADHLPSHQGCRHTLKTWLLYFSTCCLNTRQHYTYNTLHETYIHTRACALFLPVLLSQHKTALHVQYPTQNLHTRASALVLPVVSTQDSTLHETCIDTRASARGTSIYTYSSRINSSCYGPASFKSLSLHSHDVYPQFCDFLSFLFVFCDYLAQFEIFPIFLGSFCRSKFSIFSPIFCVCVNVRTFADS